MTKIKLCGLSRLCDIEAVNELRPEYVGFVFVNTRKRYISQEKAKELKLPSDEIVASSAYIVLKRLGYDPEVYLNNIKEMKLTDHNMIWTILENTNDIAKQILNPVGSYINGRRNSNGKIHL